MGIHVHMKGQPDLCGCCAVKEKLDTLWDRASGAVLTINGVYPDTMGAITVDLLQEAAVQSLIEDYIEPMRDNLDAMSTRLDGYAHVFDDYAAIVQAVNATIPGEIGDVQDYAEAIADDLLQNYLTKQAIISGYATKAEIQGLATRQDIQNIINGYVFKQGTSTPQVISGLGGLQIAGDLAVGGDITASGDTFVHWDNIAGAEIGPITISGSTTNITGTINTPDYVIANNKHPVNCNMLLAKLSDYVTLDTQQTITKAKIFYSDDFLPIRIRRDNINFNIQTKSSDRPNGNYDLFKSIMYDTNNTEVLRDYVRITKSGMYADIWTSFYDDAGTVHHPQITMVTNKTDGSSYCTLGGYYGTIPSNAIVYKGIIESTDGITNNLVHRIGNEYFIKNRKTFHANNYDHNCDVTNENLDITTQTGTTVLLSGFVDKNNVSLASLRLVIVNKHITLQCEIRNDNGTYKYVTLAEGNQ